MSLKAGMQLTSSWIDSRLQNSGFCKVFVGRCEVNMEKLSIHTLKAPIGAAQRRAPVVWRTASFYCVPQYAEHVEADAFGIIGLFIILQAWINLFDEAPEHSSCANLFS